MWLLVIVDGGLRYFRIGKELCKQGVTFGAEVSVFLVKRMAAGDRCLLGTLDMARDTSRPPASDQQQLAELHVSRIELEA